MSIQTDGSHSCRESWLKYSLPLFAENIKKWQKGVKLKRDHNPVKKIKVSVVELAQYILLCGDLAFRFAGTARAAQGVAAHRKVQNSRANGYQREIPVTHQVVMQGVMLVITGRIDGLYQYQSRTVIEEIKSTHRSVADLKAFENPLHLAQLKIYAHIHAVANSLSEIEGQLTYYHLESSAVHSFSYVFKTQKKIIIATWLDFYTL